MQSELRPLVHRMRAHWLHMRGTILKRSNTKDRTMQGDRLSADSGKPLWGPANMSVYSLAKVVITFTKSRQVPRLESALSVSALLLSESREARISCYGATTLLSSCVLCELLEGNEGCESQMSNGGNISVSSKRVRCYISDSSKRVRCYISDSS
jgi:hypothetical protein